MKFFTQRNKPKPDRYEYEFAEHVRVRIFLTLKAILSYRCNIDSVLDDLQQLILRKFGRLEGTRRYGNQVIGNAALDHISSCSDEQFLDVLEMIFHVRGEGGMEHGVNAINEILDEENIGYRLTQFLVIVEREDEPVTPQAIFGPYPSKVEYPQIILKSDELIQATVVEPALNLLADSRFATANQEFVAGLVHFRKGNYDDAIPSCGSAVESTLKTICKIKKWAYDKDKHTLC